MLMRLGRQHENEGLTEDGLFRVDCLIADGQIALEVDGPQHFVERVPNGGMLLRNRLLEARGFRVISVPFFEWNALGTDKNKQEYLLRLLDS